MAAIDLREILVLDGANRFLPRPTVALRLAVDPALGRRDLEDARMRCLQWLGGLPGVPRDVDAPTPALRVCRELLCPVVRALHAALALAAPSCTLHTAPGDEAIVAYPWSWRHTAGAIGETACALTAAALAGTTLDPGALVARLAAVLAEDRRHGDRPHFLVDPGPEMRIVSVTGSNGKTTTVRCLAHCLALAGERVGMTTSSGTWIGARQVLRGDFSGPQGARRVLEDPWPTVAVLETARGGILRHGVAYGRADVAIVLNVSDDHLGLLGIETEDEMAEVKAVIVGLTRPSGTVILNADDPRTRAMAARAPAPVVFFGREPAAESVRRHLAAGGRGVLADERAILLADGASTTRLLAIAEVPLALGGRAPAMLENALAVAAGALALGLTPEAVVRGLVSFHNTPEQNVGRLNLFTVPARGCTVVVDYAHNAVGLRVLLGVGDTLRAPGGRLLAIIASAGDRREAALIDIGRLAGSGADAIWIAETNQDLRGRTKAEIVGLLATGIAAARGDARAPYAIASGERAALEAAIAAAEAGDVIVMMCREDTEEVLAWVARHAAPLEPPAMMGA